MSWRNAPLPRRRGEGATPGHRCSELLRRIKARETVQATATISTEQAIDVRGVCPANVSTRLARARLRIPAVAVWTFAQGVEPEFVQEGKK